MDRHKLGVLERDTEDTTMAMFLYTSGKWLVEAATKMKFGLTSKLAQNLFFEETDE